MTTIGDLNKQKDQPLKLYVKSNEQILMNVVYKCIKLKMKNLYTCAALNTHHFMVNWSWHKQRSITTKLNNEGNCEYSTGLFADI